MILHFVYLAVFFLMLVQGINLVLTVIMPLKKQRFGIPMIIAAYGRNFINNNWNVLFSKDCTIDNFTV